MKKILLILLFPILLFAQKPHSGFMIQEADSSGNEYWQIKGVEIDTSKWYLSHEIMTIYIFPFDSTIVASDKDSSDAILYFQTTNTKRDIAVTEKTWHITSASDSTELNWKITQTSIGSGMYWRLIVAGQMGENNNEVGSLWELRYDGYPNVSR